MNSPKILPIFILVIAALFSFGIFLFDTLDVSLFPKNFKLSAFAGEEKIKNQKSSTIVPILKKTNPDSDITEKTETPKKLDVTLTFAGDMMFGRLVGHRHQEDNFNNLFKNFDTDIFSKSDLAWANLEGPVSDSSIQQSLKPNNFNFLFSKETISALKNLKLDIVGLANNHTFNNGQGGLTLTQELLTSNNIAWHGNPIKVNEESVYRFQKNGIKISLIAVHNLYQNADIGIEDKIKKESEENQFVIVLPHWGEEYEIKHSIGQENLARKWVENGADLIIGHHPHVVQDAQTIKNKEGEMVPVFYSLGNFIFDQTFSEETQLGLIVEIKIGQKGISGLKLFPIEAIDLYPQLTSSSKFEKIVERVCEPAGDLCLLLN